MKMLFNDLTNVPSLNVRIQKQMDKYTASLEESCGLDLRFAIPDSDGETIEEAKNNFRRHIDSLKAKRLLPKLLYFTFIQREAGESWSSKMRDNEKQVV